MEAAMDILAEAVIEAVPSAVAVDEVINADVADHSAVDHQVVATNGLVTQADDAAILDAEKTATAESAAVEAATAATTSEDPVTERVTIVFENVEDNVEKALQLVRDEGMYVAKAARQTGVSVQKLEAIVKEMKERGELTLNWDTRRDTTHKYDEDGNLIEKKKRRFIDYNYTAEDVHAAANAVKNGEYSVKSAHKAFKIPIRDIKKAMEGEEVKGRICTPKFIRIRKRGKLTEDEEKVVMEYAFALNKLKHPITFKTMAPLAKQLLKLRDETLIDENGWWTAFVKRHQECEPLYQTPKEMVLLKNNRDHWAKQYFGRLVEVFESGEFFSKPSRIYACEIEQFAVERWEPDGAKLVNVEMLVAANAVGYHVLPPCVVYASEGEEIPDFLGLPEAGFVSAEEKRVSAAILAEWFRSVFLHYLPARSAEDPVMLILRGTNEWLTPELVTMAEQQFVHLVPMNTKVLNYLNPIQPLLHNLNEAYKAKLSQYKQTELRKQSENPAKEAFFPVTLRKIFSNCFSMFEIQEVFRTRGVFPLKPDEADLTEKKEPPKEPKRWLPKGITKKSLEYPRSYKDMVKTDIIFVPPPRRQPAPAVMTPTSVAPFPVAYPGGILLNPVGMPIQLNQVVGQNLLGTNVIGATSLVNATGAVVPNPVLANVVTSQQSAVDLAKKQEQQKKLSKAFNDDVVKTVAKVAQEKDKEAQKTVAATKTTEKLMTAEPQTEQEKQRAEHERKQRLSKAFGKDVLSTVMEVTKQNEEVKKKMATFLARRASNTSRPTVTEITVTTSTAETNKTASTDSSENSNDEPEVVELDDSSNSTADVAPDVSPVDARDASSSPPILVTIREASETDSNDAPDSPSDEQPKSKKSKEASKSDVPFPIAISCTSPTTRAKAKEVVASSQNTASKDFSPTTRSKAKENVTTPSATKSSSPTTRSKSKNASPDGARSPGGTTTNSKVTTRTKGSVMSKLISTGSLGTSSDIDDDEDDDYDPEVVSSDWDSDEERASSRTKKVKTKPPKLTLAPNVTVPTKVVDRIQEMISQNSSLLTSLDKEAEERKKKPKEPEAKRDASRDSAESRLSKAFNADVLSSVLAVKQELAKRPKLPDRYALPVQTTAASGMSVLYTLPGGGQVILPASSVLPVAQRPIIVNPINLVPVTTAVTPVKSTDKITAQEESNAKKEVKNGKTKEKTDGKKVKDKKETKEKDDSEANAQTGKATTRTAKSKQKGNKDQTKRAKRKKNDVNDESASEVSKEATSDQIDTAVRKSSRKQAGLPVRFADVETVGVDNSPTSQNTGSEKLTGSRKRKASLLASRGGDAAHVKDETKKGKVVSDEVAVSLGITTRAKRLEASGASKRTRSMKK